MFFTEVAATPDLAAPHRTAREFNDASGTGFTHEKFSCVKHFLDSN